MAVASAGVQLLSKTQLSPASSAGEPARSASVWVGPPLLANGPRRGSIGEPLVPIRSPDAPGAEVIVAPELLPMRLCPREVNAPKTSGSVSAEFPAMIVFLLVTVPRSL